MVVAKTFFEITVLVKTYACFFCKFIYCSSFLLDQVFEVDEA